MKKLSVCGIGAALFFLLGRFVTVPSPVETVDICVQYGLLAYLAVTYGPLTGALAGLAGHILIDVSLGEPCWSWLLATTADRDHLIRFNLCQIAVHVVCWAGIAPVLEILIYSESMDRIFKQGLTAALSNAVTTAIVGSLLLTAHAALQRRK